MCINHDTNPPPFADPDRIPHISFHTLEVSPINVTIRLYYGKHWKTKKKNEKQSLRLQQNKNNIQYTNINTTYNYKQQTKIETELKGVQGTRDKEWPLAGAV